MPHSREQTPSMSDRPREAREATVRKYLLKLVLKLSIAHITMGLLIITIGALFMVFRCFGYQAATPIWGGVVFLVTGGIGCLLYNNAHSRSAGHAFEALALASTIIAIIIIAHAFAAAANELNSSYCNPENNEVYDPRCGSVPLRVSLDVALVLLGAIEMMIALLSVAVGYYIMEGGPEDLIGDGPMKVSANNHSRPPPRRTTTSSSTTYANQYSEDPTPDVMDEAPKRSRGHDNVAYANTLIAEERQDRQRRARSRERLQTSQSPHQDGSQGNQERVPIEQLDHPPRVITPSNRRREDAQIEMAEVPAIQKESITLETTTNPSYGNESDDWRETSNTSPTDRDYLAAYGLDEQNVPSARAASDISTPSLSGVSTQASSEKLNTSTPSVKHHRYDEVPDEGENAEPEGRHDDRYRDGELSAANIVPAGHRASSFSSSGWSSEYYDTEQATGQPPGRITPHSSNPALSSEPRDRRDQQGPVFVAEPISSSDEYYDVHDVPRQAVNVQARPKPYSGPGDREKFTEGSIRKSLEKLYGEPVEAKLFVVGSLNVEPAQVPQINERISDEDLYLASPTNSMPPQHSDHFDSQAPSHHRSEPSLRDSAAFSDGDRSTDTLTASGEHVYPHSRHHDFQEPQMPPQQMDRNPFQPSSEEYLPEYSPTDSEWKAAKTISSSREGLASSDSPPEDRPPSDTRSLPGVSYRRPWQTSKNSVYSAPDHRSTNSLPTGQQMDLDDFAASQPTRSRNTQRRSRPPARSSDYYHGLVYRPTS
ncbi:uncharacterized protein [Ptychodera flava]|uniref:uncharacterized protein n=1 Tax=Ptychodera flava TaxID=63121 RepID=UPI00396A038A